MLIENTSLAGLKIIAMELNEDHRGSFARAYCKEEFSENGITCDFVQDNISHNHKKNTIRGMHWQAEPYTDDKIVRCIKGAIFDVAVDIRRNSPTYLQWFGMELNEYNQKALFLPKGFAHGFQTLQDNSVLYYKVSQPYHKASGRGLFYRDPKLRIKWAALDGEPIVSEQDLGWSRFI